MQKLKSALRITLNALFVLYTFWHIGFIYILLYILQNYVLYGLLQDTTEMAVFFLGGIAWVMTVFSLIIAGVCFTFRKKSFGIIYSVVFAAGMCVFLIFTCFDSIAVLPNMPEWYSYLILSVLNIERLPYPSLFISVALIVIVSLIILYAVVSHIVDRHKAQKDTYYSERFDNYRANIEYFTDYLRLNFGTEPSKGLYVEFIGEEPSVSDKNGSVPIDERAKESLCAVRDFFTKGFCYIDFTSEETAFFGIGSERLVYRDDRTPPSCFFGGESKRNFFTYDLGDGWYYLVLAVR